MSDFRVLSDGLGLDTTLAPKLQPKALPPTWAAPAPTSPPEAAADVSFQPRRRFAPGGLLLVAAVDLFAAAATLVCGLTAWAYFSGAFTSIPALLEGLPLRMAEHLSQGEPWQAALAVAVLVAGYIAVLKIFAGETLGELVRSLVFRLATKKRET